MSHIKNGTKVIIWASDWQGFGIVCEVPKRKPRHYTYSEWCNYSKNYVFCRVPSLKNKIEPYHPCTIFVDKEQLKAWQLYLKCKEIVEEGLA